MKTASECMHKPTFDVISVVVAFYVVFGDVSGRKSSRFHFGVQRPFFDHARALSTCEVVDAIAAKTRRTSTEIAGEYRLEPILVSQMRLAVSGGSSSSS